MVRERVFPPVGNQPSYELELSILDTSSSPTSEILTFPRAGRPWTVFLIVTISPLRIQRAKYLANFIYVQLLVEYQVRSRSKVHQVVPHQFLVLEQVQTCSYKLGPKAFASSLVLQIPIYILSVALLTRVP